MVVHNNCVETVESIIAEKKKNASMWRSHPDAPGCEAAIQYWAQTEDDQTEKSGVEEKQTSSLETELSREAARTLISDRLSHSSSVASSSAIVAQREQASDTKTAEKDAQRAARAAARLHQKQQDKEERERQKETPQNKAMTWTSKLKRDSGKANMLGDDIMREETVPEGIRTTYSAQFKASARNLAEIARELGKITMQSDPGECTDLGNRATQAAEEFNNTNAAWRVTHKIHQPKKPKA